MSKAAGLLVLTIAVLSGLFASAAVMNYIQSQKSTSAEKPNTQAVVIAKQDIPSGTTLRREHIEAVARLVDSIPKNAIQDPEQILGRMTRATIYTGEVVVGERLVDPGSPGGLPALIPPGFRAITLRVDDTNSVAGFVQPGHRVDIVTTVNDTSPRRDSVSKVILQNIRVIAVGQNIESSDEKKAKVVPTVTVLVTLEQAERIALASNVGHIRLVLRNYEDKALLKTEGIRLSNLIPSANADVQNPVEPQWPPAVEVEPTPAPSPKPQTVVIYRGRTKSEVSFYPPHLSGVKKIRK